MTAKKSTVETTVDTTFVIPLAELLDAFVAKEEREKPLTTWWVFSSGESSAQMVHIVRSERTSIAYDEEGRERLEEEREETHNDL